MEFIESDKNIFVTSELLFNSDFLAVHRVQLCDEELYGTFINQHICLLIRSLAHLTRHPSTSSVHIELCIHFREDNSVWFTPEFYELPFVKMETSFVTLPINSRKQSTRLSFPLSVADTVFET